MLRELLSGFVWIRRFSGLFIDVKAANIEVVTPISQSPLQTSDLRGQIVSNITKKIARRISGNHGMPAVLTDRQRLYVFSLQMNDPVLIHPTILQFDPNGPYPVPDRTCVSI